MIHRVCRLALLSALIAALAAPASYPHRDNGISVIVLSNDSEAEVGAIAETLADQVER